MQLGFTPVVSLSRKRLDPWDCDKSLWKLRNELERLFCRIKGFRRVLRASNKLDVMYIGVNTFALIVDGLRLR